MALHPTRSTLQAIHQSSSSTRRRLTSSSNCLIPSSSSSSSSSTPPLIVLLHHHHHQQQQQQQHHHHRITPSIPSSNRSLRFKLHRYPFTTTTLNSTQSSSHQKQQQQEKSRQSHQKNQSNHEDSLPAGVSPWARFMDVLKSEYAKSQEMQENVRELTGTAQGIKDSEAAQRMRKAYTAMRLERLIQENPKLATMAKSLTTTGRSVTEAVNKVANEIEESRIIQAAKRMGKELDKRIAEPIRNTQVYKVVEDTMDFSQGALRYGGYIEKEERKRRRQKRLQRLAQHTTPSQHPTQPPIDLPQSSSASIHSVHSPSPSSSSSSSSIDKSNQDDRSGFVENPNAPPALILHPTANENSGQDAKDSQTIRSRLGSMTPDGIKEVWRTIQDGYQESENPMISTFRSFNSFIKRHVFDETETARVIRLIKQVDPSFNFDHFLVDLREFIVPDFVDSFIDNDLQSLKLWTSEAAFNVTTAPMKMYLQRGLRPANQIIDLKGIDIISAKVLEERDLPVFIVGFKTHEINCYINPNKKKLKIKENGKKNEEEDKNRSKESEDVVEVGSREEIQQVHYVLILTKESLLNSSSPSKSDPDPTESQSSDSQDLPLSSDSPNSSITGGWKIIDLARRSTVAFL